MQHDFFKRTWSEISLDALRENYTCLRGLCSAQTAVMAVVKADAYGHGVTHIVRELDACGCAWFGVSNLEEALQVRAVCRDKNILVLGFTPPEYASELALNHISQAVLDLAYAKQLAEAAHKNGLQVNIHLKVDTGMSRLGLLYHDSARDAAAIDVAAEICRLPGLFPEGIFTHFARADEPEQGEAFTRLQFDLFLDCIARLERAGIRFGLRHCCNSAGMALYHEMHLDLVRPGLVLYGLPPCDAVRERVTLLPAMQMKSVISMLKQIPSGTPVSYGGTYTSAQPLLAATVPIGYADGYPRLLSRQTHMFVRGCRAPVLGTICMDQCVLDVSGVNGVRQGDVVTVFGQDGSATLPVTQLAEQCGTLSYEIVCGISKRVPRVYTRGGKICAVADYLLYQSHLEA